MIEAPPLLELIYNTADIIQTGGIKLDLKTHTAYIDSHPLTLTRLEFDVLVFLAFHADQIIPVAELLQHVWKCNPERGGTPEQVKHCIYRLRRKIEPNPRYPIYLRSVRGRGYIMPLHLGLNYPNQFFSSN